MNRELGHIAPRELWALVNSHRIRAGMGLGALASTLGTTEGKLWDWANRGRAPCAAVLLAAERWVEVQDQCRFCGGFGQIAAHPDLIGSPKIPCGACGGSGRAAGGER